MGIRLRLALALCCALDGAGARAEPPHTLTFVVGATAGGSYDLYSRLFANHIADHLPGHPRVVVENMGAAGGLVAANYLFNVAPHDGSMIGMISQTAAIGQAVGVPGVLYDVRRFTWIGRLTSNTQVLETWHTSKVKSFADAKLYPAVLAGTGPTSSSVVFPKIMNDQLGTKFRLVPGFPGEAPATLAMQRGEVEGVVRPWADLQAKNPDWITNHIINPIVQFAITRNPTVPAPAIVDLAETKAQRELFALFASGDDIGDAVVAPPGTPQQAVDILRRAYADTLKDSPFLADVARTKSPIDPLDGDSLRQLNKEVFDVSPETIRLAKTYAGVR